MGHNVLAPNLRSDLLPSNPMPATASTRIGAFTAISTLYFRSQLLALYTLLFRSINKTFSSWFYVGRWSFYSALLQGLSAEKAIGSVVKWPPGRSSGICSIMLPRDISYFSWRARRRELPPIIYFSNVHMFQFRSCYITVIDPSRFMDWIALLWKPSKVHIM